MKKNILKLIPFVFTAIVVGTLLLYACTQQQELTPANAALPGIKDNVAADTGNISNLTGLNRTVGTAIDGELGRKWINNHFNATGKTYSYTIPASELQALLNKGAMGISLYYAVDDRDQLHVLPLGVDAKSIIMKSTDVITVNSRVDWATSQQWIKGYTGEVRAHFFGADAYIQLLRQLKGEKVLVTAALNDDNRPQLLMSDASITTPPQFTDHSMPCPYTCPDSN